MFNRLVWCMDHINKPTQHSYHALFTVHFSWKELTITLCVINYLWLTVIFLMLTGDCVWWLSAYKGLMQPLSVGNFDLLYQRLWLELCGINIYYFYIFLLNDKGNGSPAAWSCLQFHLWFLFGFKHFNGFCLVSQSQADLILVDFTPK